MCRHGLTDGDTKEQETEMTEGAKRGEKTPRGTNRESCSAKYRT